MTGEIETDTSQPNQHSNETYNNHYCIEINSIHKPLVIPLVSKMIIGDTLVNYLCDWGTYITIINENLLNKIKASNQSDEITPNNSKTILSCSGDIKVFGTITESQLVIYPNKILKNTKIIATNHNSRYPCVLVRDLINELPKTKTHLDNMKETVNTVTNEVKSYFLKRNREKNSNNIWKIDLSEEIEENLSIHSLFNIDQETSDNEEMMSTLRSKAQE